MSTSKPVRVRFAPSPTGELHLGGARTALYNYLFARQHGGAMVLRIEDTDQKRYVSGAMDRFLEDLAWLGIVIDEGPDQGGEYGPYIQSERVGRYRSAAHALVASGHAYYELGTGEGGIREDDEYRRGRNVYRGATRDADQGALKREIDKGAPFVVRLKVLSVGNIEVHDLVRGSVTFNLATVDDAVLLKSDGLPTYHLAAVIDDHEMAISHVFRSEEWLPSTPKHLLLYQALGWMPPQFAHLPLLLAHDGKKLSKRMHGPAVWVRTYRDQGYIPEAFVNYLALLGWNPGGDEEFFSLDQLVTRFSLEHVHKAGAKFDQDKLDAFQRHWVSRLNVEDLAGRLQPFLGTAIHPDLLHRMIVVTQPRLGRLSEFQAAIQFFLVLPDYDPRILVFRKSTREQTKAGLVAARSSLGQCASTTWHDTNELKHVLEHAVAASGLGNADLFWPVRVALTGQERSPSPSECLWVLGQEESLSRLGQAIRLLDEAR